MIRSLIDPGSATPLGVAFLDDPADVPSDDPAGGRRLRVFRMTPEFLVNLFEAGGTFRVESGGLPADARPVSISYDPSRHAFALVLHSESYGPVAEGEPIPGADDVFVRGLAD